ncbi:MAG: MFS transporter [Kiritimatiellia bacterium]
MSKDEAAPALPSGVNNAFLFQILNATSWSIILGTPMLLYFKNLGASGLVLGITVAMIPLFGALQIPAANFVERVGYKNFVVRGWTSRSIFILGVAAGTFLPESTPPTLRMTFILVMLGCFAAARGISVCGYLPWITQLIPETLRGTFIARESMCMYLALTGTMLFSSWWVGVFPSTRAYGVMFLISYAAALCSLFFLKRIPDVQGVKPSANAARPPWKEMLAFPPFRRFVTFNVVLNLFISALGVVWLPFMKDGFGASGRLILGLAAYSSLIAALISLIIGPVADRTGSRPLLGFSSLLILTSQFLWMSLAAGLLPRHPVVPFLITTVGAMGYPMMGLASSRLLMGLVPAMGRSHFFAISSVAISLTLGLMPVLWGLALDGLTPALGDGISLHRHWTWNCYSLLYAIVFGGTLISQFFRRRLDEPRAMPTEEFLRILFVQSPNRLVNRMLSSFRRFHPLG